ncbi:ECF-type sigma factor [Nocardia vaccinii]|uniref:ECF-type sigma factor n=1 Tax=Nocardia vaccinii TaxID=1822 RepID=UPI0008301CF7|nr:ECF-type sigma factor [Nocardia vaccinii]
MALVGLVRVSTSKQETQRQHDDLDEICVRVFEEKISKRRAILARHAEGQSLREIARGVGVSLAVVHGEVKLAQSAESAGQL